MAKDSAKQDSKNAAEKQEQSLYWADQIADEILSRNVYRYNDHRIKKFDEYVVKTSASLSGVLHIGRLSDTIRSHSVHKALLDAGVKSRLIWVSEDMDPLRKVPAGVPADFEKYLGMPVTDIPDPDGCHKSYAEHHREEYLKVIHQFVDEDMETFSMREEYKKGTFRPFIKRIIENVDAIKTVLMKYRDTPLPEGWSPWTPICGKCGKIATPKITSFEEGKVHYVCSDYNFETTTAKGCGHKGINDPLKGEGKLMWKSEWAAQWAYWKICSEGAGKEYQVPNSAFWVNSEIAETVLDYPHPVPIFYEHLMIDNKKMSASVGNVVYPKDWLAVASPELLRVFYNKRLMKTRSFSWADIPRLYDEYDRMLSQYWKEEDLQGEDVKKEEHERRLFEMSHGEHVRPPLKLSFSHAVMVSQFFEKEEDIIHSLEKTGQWEEEKKKEIFDRLGKASAWLKDHVPEESRLVLQSEVPAEIKSGLSDKQRRALKRVAEIVEEKEWGEKELHNQFYEICKREGLDPKEFFSAAYIVLFRRERGPQLANFLISLGDRALGLFKKL
ncbi:MAG TPA: lysine--tRNA ligase [Candidatus Nanoarchaeia archaeon]|nr:lysine--tRNA ligase [Candidatus Nanoarchaeia archaeon]